MKKRAKNTPPAQPNAPFCDWQAKISEIKKISTKSTIYRYKGNYKWKGIKTEAYKPVKSDWDKIMRRVLVGDSLKAKSHVRYFEIAPGGQSSFEKHRHKHIVIGIRGRGKVLLDGRFYKMGFLDVIYISPNTPHQLLNPFDEPFGFFCVVPAKKG